AGTELDDPAGAERLEPARALAGQAGAEQGRDLRRGNEIAVAAKAPAAAGVIAEPGLVEDAGHEVVETDPAAALGDPGEQAGAQLGAGLVGVGIGYGELIHAPIVESRG